MRQPFLTFLDLIYPFILGLIFLLATVFLKKSTNNGIRLSLLEIVSLDLPFNSLYRARICFVIIAFCLFSVPAFRDYSGFFPSHYDMDVFFDDYGIERSFEIYTDEEVKSLKLHNNWKKEKAQYLSKLSKDVSLIMGVDDFFIKGEEFVHSAGQTTFFVDKIKGFQKYHISKSSGELIHVMELPGGSKKQFHSRFDLMDTADKYFSVSLLDIYLKYSKILFPYYKQIGILDPVGKKIIYHHYLIALIKVRFFPIAEIGNTIYLVKSSDGEHWVPIGYAIYRAGN